MIIFILGTNGSGKSLYDEKLISNFKVNNLYYIATMILYGYEEKLRIEKHRKQRQLIEFVTIEKPYQISEIFLPPDVAVLL